VEQTSQALEARKLVYEGRREFIEQTNLLRAKEKYEAGLAKWREVLDLPEFQGQLVRDRNLGRDLIEAIQLYQRILDACDEPFPKEFILQDVLDRHGHMMEEL
jgi:hypothetical protein